MSETLIIGIPSKGRLHDHTEAFFARAGLPFSQSRGTRDYRGQIAGIAHCEVQFISASEIATLLAGGQIHIGVTGEDLIREKIAKADQQIEFLTPLGFGKANVVVAAPKAWIDVDTMDDINDIAAEIRINQGRKLRVATKYINLTRKFFARHGITDYVIVESSGATEGAPGSGIAELVVDITSSGETLEANGLKIISDGIILESQANLVASLNACWNQKTRHAAETLLNRIAAEEEARACREIRLVLDEETAMPDLERVLAEFDISTLHMIGNHIAVIWCPVSQIFSVINELQKIGSSTISVRKLDYLFKAENSLIRRLYHRISSINP
jgi:ATP phosphoribosyltransferase